MSALRYVLMGCLLVTSCSDDDGGDELEAECADACDRYSNCRGASDGEIQDCVNVCAALDASADCATFVRQYVTCVQGRGYCESASAPQCNDERDRALACSESAGP